ncbi:MAG: radical SAM family heme chaperone HemW [Candidatus Riflebacteria bacterium]|nr:radical SAM family heme chaperone HemW [Candidatus Riflebacteria bacterium]
MANSVEALYIHVPFCLRKCDYCSFYSISPDEELIALFLTRLQEELAENIDLLSEELTIFIGGGNPTCIGEKAFGRLLEILEPVIATKKIREFTVESNPETLSEAIGNGLKCLPELRLSLGVQRFKNEELKLIGRNSNTAVLFNAFETAFKLTPNVGMDLILGIPGCTSIRQELQKKFGEFPFSHVSAYFLSIEEKTPLYQKLKNAEIGDPTEIGPEELFEVRDFLETENFRHYEISNFCKLAHECKHNLNYWFGKDYVGLGPSAVSTIKMRRISNPSNFSDWLSGPGQSVEIIDKNAEICEFLMLRLRLVHYGFSFEEFENRFRGHSESTLTLVEKSIKNQLQKGFLEPFEDRIRLSKQGIVYANEVISSLFP